MHMRLACDRDAGNILAVYAPYVENTAISFEMSPPDPETFRNRIAGISAQYPYLVWEEGGKIRAYAYASRFKEREAYLFDVEASIYIAPACQGRGIGKALYTALFRLLEEQGYYTAYAGITLPNEKSIGLHEVMGFRHVGVYRKTGFKLGRWLDVALMEKSLREYNKAPAYPKAITELDSSFINTVLTECEAMISVREE